MTNPYYVHSSGAPATQTRGSSQTMRAELDLIEDGFDAVAASPIFTGPVALTSGQIGYPATQVPSSDPNTLDDYEENVAINAWTPIDGSGAGLTFTSAIGQYVKIGCMVFLQMELQYPATANASLAKIGGLPFQVRSGGISRASLAVGYVQSSLAVCAYISGSGGSELIVLDAPAGGLGLSNSSLSGKRLYISGWYIASA